MCLHCRLLYLSNSPSTLSTGKQTSSATLTVLFIPSPTRRPPPVLPSPTHQPSPAPPSLTHPPPLAPLSLTHLPLSALPSPTRLSSSALSMSHEPSVNDSKLDQLTEDISKPLQNSNHSKDTNKSHSNGLSNSVKGKQKVAEIPYH